MAGKAVVKDNSASDGSRTGDKDVDHLHFYLTSSHYDCTFSASVSKEGSCAKSFKCHRFILAAASTAFEKMLFGNFKESNQGRDDEIKMEVSPTVFDLAMRFIYGNKCDFKSCELAVKIYYFAHHTWMIEGLVRAAGKFLIKKQSPDDVLLVYQMCIDLNIGPETELRKGCHMIIQDEIIRVLSSKQWLGASKGTVLRIYCMTCLNVGEAFLFTRLVAWGKARCSNGQSKSVRAEIDEMLEDIRFRSMSCQEFSAISKECDVFTLEEKLKILESLSLSDVNLMPPRFCLTSFPRYLTNSKMFDWGSVEELYERLSQNECTSFSFYVDVGGIFLDGIYLHSVDNAVRGHHKVISFTCTVRKADSGQELASRKIDGDCTKVNKPHSILFDEPVALAKGILYDMQINYRLRWSDEKFVTYKHAEDRKFWECPGFCTIFFHPRTKVRDVYGFQLLKR